MTLWIITTYLESVTIFINDCQNFETWYKVMFSWRQENRMICHDLFWQKFCLCFNVKCNSTLDDDHYQIGMKMLFLLQ